jgi:hypothetical protein
MTEQNTVPPAKKPSLLFGLAGVVAIFAFTTAWVYLGGRVLHLQSFYASFVFAWYWGIVDKAAFSRLPSSILASLLGVAVSWQLSYFSARYGTAGLGIGIGVIAVLLYMQIMHWAAYVITPATMLFLAVFTAPQLLGKIDSVDAGATIVAGALYMAGVIYVLKRVTGMGADPKAG